MRVLRIGLLTFVLACAACATPPKSSIESTDGFVVVGAKVFDGEQFRTGNVHVRGGTIEGFVDAPPKGVRTIDGRGHTLLPGLIDGHTHVGMEKKHLERFVSFGVTSVVDLFGPPELIRELRRRDVPTRAALFGAGNLATAPRGHGTEYGVPIPTLERPEEASSFVAARRQEGSDFLKIVFDTSVADIGGQKTEMPTLGLETVRALVEAAHAQKLVVAIHTGGCEDVRKMVDLGPDIIAHGCALAENDRLPDSLAGRHIYFNPTLAVQLRPCGMEYWIPLVADPEIARRLTDEERPRLGKDRNDHDVTCSSRRLDFVRRAARAGVRIIAGPDSPNRRIPVGASLLAELDLLTQAGMTPEQVFASATSNPASAYRLVDRGHIARGMRADLLLVEGDASERPRAVWHTRKVWRSGVLSYEAH